VRKTAEKVKNGKVERYSHGRPIKNLTAAIRSIRPARHTGYIQDLDGKNRAFESFSGRGG
jgi:hypothetical protein